MPPKTPTTIATLVARLDWETNHFGVQAAQLTDAALDDVSLESALRQARRQGVQWLVWATDGTRSAPAGLLDRFAGTLVDRKATFVRSLADETSSGDDGRNEAPPVVEYSAAKASPELVELAIASGEYSRFRLDPGSATSDSWPCTGSGSTVACPANWPMPCWSRSAATCRGASRTVIGRHDLSIRVPGRRVDRAGRRGGRRARTGRRRDVDPRRTSVDAWPRRTSGSRCYSDGQCTGLRLYERAGYRLSQVRNIYHFWPQAGWPNADAATRGPPDATSAFGRQILDRRQSLSVSH